MINAIFLREDGIYFASKAAENPACLFLNPAGITNIHRLPGNIMDYDEMPEQADLKVMRGKKPPRGIGAMLRQAHRAYSQALQQKLLPLDVTLPQYLHLRVLWEKENLTQVEISQHVGIEKASSTAVFDTLEKNGLIKRTRSKSDRRKVKVALTSAGKALEPLLRPRAKSIATKAIFGLDEADTDIFIMVLHKIISNLELPSPPPAVLPEKCGKSQKSKPPR
jgi:DNA-binding MarR family transcriptional regulator